MVMQQSGWLRTRGVRLTMGALLALALLVARLDLVGAASPPGARSTQPRQGLIGGISAWGSGYTASPQGIGAREDFVAIAAKGGHTLAVATDGTVWAWGGNLVPVQVAPAQLTGVSAVAAGEFHDLALKADGSVWAWGSNTEGQLGNGGSGGTNSTPARVNGLPAIIDIAAGWRHSLALAADGSVWAWGNDGLGELGDGTVANESGCQGGCSTAPKRIVHAAVSNIVAVEAGRYDSLALRADGTVWVWGMDTHGEHGDGANRSEPACNTECDPTPTQVATGVLKNIVAISFSTIHILALAADGTVWAWGSNLDGQLGRGVVGPIGTCTNGCGDTPTPVSPDVLPNIVAIAAGAEHSLALAADGSVWAWGGDNLGQLGDGAAGGEPINDTLNPTPTQIAPASLSGVVAIAAGEYYSLALRQESAAATRTFSSGLQGVAGLAQPRAVDRQLALATGGTVWARDMNTGALTQVAGLPLITAIAAGGTFNLALADDGTVWAWGNNDRGQLGNGTVGGSSPTPIKIPTLANIIAIAASSFNGAALMADGTVWVWGFDDGQLGDGDVGDEPGCDGYCNPTPSKVELSNVTAVALGGSHVQALRANGTVWGWGYNGYGQIGTGGSGLVTEPTPIQSLSGIVAIAVRSFHSLGLAADGTVWAWGENDNGELGIGTPSRIEEDPVQIPPAALSGIVAIAVDSSSSVALAVDGTVWAWGDDSVGPLSVPVSSTCGCYPAPAQVPPATLNQVVAITADFGITLITGFAVPTTIDAANVTASYGDASAALTATVVADEGTVPGGDVTFTVRGPGGAFTVVGSPVQGTVTGGGASASFPLAGVGVGSYTVTARYNGAAGLFASTDPSPATLTINKAKTSTSIGTATVACGSTTVMVPVTVANDDNAAALTGGNVAVTIKQGGATKGTGNAAISGADPVTVNVQVAVGGGIAGAVTIEAAYNGDANFVESINSINATIAVGNAGATVTGSGSGTYGDASATLTATVTAAGNAPLTGGRVTFVVRKGTQTLATLTSGVVTGSSPATVSVALPLNASYNAGSYTIEVSYSGFGCVNPATGNGTLTVGRKVLWLKPQDRTVGLHQPNPATTPPAGCLAQATATRACWLELANGSTFAYGQSWSVLNLSALRFQYNRNPPATNASETVGKTYRITAFGIASGNYDIRFQQGTLTVGP